MADPPRSHLRRTVKWLKNQITRARSLSLNQPTLILTQRQARERIREDAQAVRVEDPEDQVVGQVVRLQEQFLIR